MLHSSLLDETVQLAIDDRVLILNSAADPFVPEVARRLSAGELILAEDNIASLMQAYKLVGADLSRTPPMYQPLSLERKSVKTQLRVRHVPFHEYTLHEAPATINVTLMNMVHQPGNAWMLYALQVAAFALKTGGKLYVLGAKDRGVLSIAKRMQSLFGNIETLAISKGQRVICSRMENNASARSINLSIPLPTPTAFAEGKLDEGTRLLLEALQVHATDVALDMGSGAGYIGLHIAHLASKGQVTMVETSLASVDAVRHVIEQCGLNNVQVVASDGIQAVKAQRYDLVVTNPPFHLGGIQTTGIAERFIREAAQVLRPRGRFYLVANRFLKYEPTLRACFQNVEEVGGNTRFKVLLATNALMNVK